MVHTLNVRCAVCTICASETKSTMARRRNHRFTSRERFCDLLTQDIGSRKIECCTPTTCHKDKIVIIKVHVVECCGIIQFRHCTLIIEKSSYIFCFRFRVVRNLSTLDGNNINICSTVKIDIVRIRSFLKAYSCLFSVFQRFPVRAAFRSQSLYFLVKLE